MVVCTVCPKYPANRDGNKFLWIRIETCAGKPPHTSRPRFNTAVILYSHSKMPRKNYDRNFCALLRNVHPFSTGVPIVTTVHGASIDSTLDRSKQTNASRSRLATMRSPMGELESQDTQGSHCVSPRTEAGLPKAHRRIIAKTLPSFLPPRVNSSSQNLQPEFRSSRKHPGTRQAKLENFRHAGARDSNPNAKDLVYVCSRKKKKTFPLIRLTPSAQRRSIGSARQRGRVAESLVLRGHPLSQAPIGRNPIPV